MARTSLRVLAVRAGLWSIVVPHSRKVAILPSEVVKYGSEAPPAAVAEVILRHMLKCQQGRVMASALHALMRENGYAPDPQTRAKVLSRSHPLPRRGAMR